MFRTIATVGLLTLATALPLQQANAQDPTLGGALVGGLIGAGIGGAATGKAGGAVVGGVIGAVAGAAIANDMEARRGNYYWYRGDCWRRRGNGSHVRTYRRYCN